MLYPLINPFFFRCKLINPWVDYLLINPFSIDQPNQPSNTEFIIIYKKPTIRGLIRLINGKRVYQEIINPWVYQFATEEKPFFVFQRKKGWSRGRARYSTYFSVINPFWRFIILRKFLSVNAGIWGKLSRYVPAWKSTQIFWSAVLDF